MTDLYVENITKQKIRFSFRIPENHQVIVAEIPIGGQKRMLDRDLTGPECEAIIDQLQRGFGAIEGREVARHKGFVGLAYSTTKRFTMDAIAEGVEANVDIRTQQAADLRQGTAVAMHHKAAQIMGAPDGDTSPVRQSDVTIKEVVGRGDEGSGFGEERIEIRRQGEGGEVRRSGKRTLKALKPKAA